MNATLVMAFSFFIFPIQQMEAFSNNLGELEISNFHEDKDHLIEEIVSEVLFSSNSKTSHSKLAIDCPETNPNAVVMPASVINVTSTATDGDYFQGQIITLVVEFTAPVNVFIHPVLQEAPLLHIETGTVDTFVEYSSGSGTSTLNFNYLIQPSHRSSDLDYTSTGALVINSAFINDGGGNPANLTLPAPGALASLGANKDLTINQVPTPTYAFDNYVFTTGNGQVATLIGLINTEPSGTITLYDALTGGNVISASLVSGTTVYASQTIQSVASTNRLAISVQQISEAIQTLPALSTVANLLTTPTSGHQVNWYNVASGGTSLMLTDVLSTGSYFVEQEFTGTMGTETSNRALVNVTAEVAAPTYEFDNYIFTSGNNQISGLINLLSGEPGATFKFYDNATGGNEITTTFTTGTTVFAAQVSNGVESTDRLAIPVNEIANANQIAAHGDTVVDLIATPTAGATATWYDMTSGGTALPDTDLLTSGTYYVQQGTTTTSSVIAAVPQNIQGLAEDNQGNFIVPCWDLGAEVYRVDALGNTTLLFIDDDVDYVGFNDAAVDAAGFIYMPTRESGVLRIDSNGMNEIVLGSQNFFGLGIAIDGNGDFIIADTFNSSIIKMAPNGTVTATLATLPYNPRRVAVAPDGDIFITSQDMNILQKMDPQGNNLVDIALIPARNIEFDNSGQLLYSAGASIGIMNPDGTNNRTLINEVARDITVTDNGEIYFVNDSQLKKLNLGSTSNRVAVQVTIPQNFVYENSTWTPNDPTDSVNPSGSGDTVIIRENVAVNGSFSAYDLTVENNATLSLTAGSQIEIYNNCDLDLDASDAKIIAIGQIPANSWNLDGTLGTFQPENAGINLNGTLNITKAITNDDNVSSSTLDLTNADLTFKSDVSGTAVIEGGQIVIQGDVTVERYYQNRRAYRFLSIPVTTSTTIFDNLQQGGLNPGDAGFESGYGTHITGPSAPANGFDPTATNNLSMFSWSNLNQMWTSQSSTNLSADVLTAGDYFRLMIRGDRTIDLSSNASSSSTTLRMKGALLNSDFTLPTVAANSGEYTIVTNPYQSNLDIASELNALFNATSTDLTALNPDFYYIWDPMGNSRGSYRTYSRSLNTLIGASVAGSDYVPGIIKPGQAVFLVASGVTNGNAILRRDSNTALRPSGPSIVSNSSLGNIDLQLYEQNAYNHGQESLDGLLVSFDQNGDNSTTTADAKKLYNLDENIARNKAGERFIVEQRALPTNNEELELFINNFRHSNYTIVVRPTDLNGVMAYLQDNYTNTLTALDSNQSTTYQFSVDSNSTSTASDRFKLVFRNSTLSVGDDLAFAKAIQLYPNPVIGDKIYIDLGGRIGEKTIVLSNLQGQKINQFTTLESGELELDMSDLSKALYLITVLHDGEETTLKLLVN
ncbi:carboxypeptidase T [Nonlabens dokdonensis DSW-6]|uniref:Carboxypeptidase T n=2 Tax=Nonlabens dokdonensis TaxID=328515 RepID=L7WC48_NONDD|nr:carboxypeptidase T [Nonlabens dokdonensis DSW-6]